MNPSLRGRRSSCSIAFDAVHVSSSFSRSKSAGASGCVTISPFVELRLNRLPAQYGQPLGSTPALLRRECDQASSRFGLDSVPFLSRAKGLREGREGTSVGCRCRGRGGQCG